MQEILKELTQPEFGSEGINLSVVIPSLLIALVLSYLIALTYKKINREREDHQVIMHTLILLAVTIAAAMMVIGNNLARAFGLVGAVSIIRFRTAVKNAKDMAFVFIAIVIGMASGLGFWLTALVFAIFAGIILLCMEWLRFGQRLPGNRRFEVQIKCGADVFDMDGIEKILRTQTKKWRFESLRIEKKWRIYSYQIEVEAIKGVEELTKNITQAVNKSALSLRIISL
jgi:uncharacterized membrane protein YhiD involved in acid resistance